MRLAALIGSLALSFSLIGQVSQPAPHNQKLPPDQIAEKTKIDNITGRTSGGQNGQVVNDRSPKRQQEKKETKNKEWEVKKQKEDERKRRAEQRAYLANKVKTKKESEQKNIKVNSADASLQNTERNGLPSVMAPSNDDCAGAISLTPASSCAYTAGTSSGATQSLAAITCGGFTGNADDDVWYKFTATTTSAVITVVGSASYDAVVDFRSGACNGSNVNCADNSVSGGTETISASGMTVGSTYYIRIYEYGTGSGSSTFSVCVTTPTASDNCADAISLGTVSTTTAVAGNNSSASNDQDGTSSCTVEDQNVWYTFTVPSGGGTYSLGVNCGTLYEPGISLSTGSCGALTELYCNDYCWGTGSSSSVSMTGICLPAGTYYVSVDDDYWDCTGTPGSYTLTVKQTSSGGAPSNDASSAAINLGTVSTTTTTTGTNVCALADEANDCSFTWTNNVWYKFTVPAGGGTYSVNVSCGTMYEPAVALCTGSPGSLSPLSCNDWCWGTGSTSSVSLSSVCLPPGTYYVGVDDNAFDCSGTPGTFSLTVKQTSSGGAASNDLCANAINLGTVSTTTTTTGTNVCAAADETSSCSFTFTQNVWYKFTVPAGGGSYSVNIACGTLYEPAVAMFSGSCGSLTALPCNDYCWGTGTTTNVKLTSVCLGAGTYYLAVDDNAYDCSGTPGTFTITVTQTSGGVSLPTNDPCASATALSLTATNNNAAQSTAYSATVSASNTCASADQSNTSCFTNNSNLWYTFTPTTSGNFYVGVKGGTMSKPEVAILSGSCGSLTSLGCAGSTSTSAQAYGYYSSSYSYAGACNLTAGTTYYIMIDNRSSGSSGTFTATVSSLSNDQIAGAGIISSCGTSFASSTIGATNCGNCYGTGGYNNLDCTGSYDTYSSGMTVENDSWYQFCTTSAATYSVTISPTSSTCIGPDANTSTELQMNLLTGTPGLLTWKKGGVVGNSGSLTYTISLAANACAYIEVDGYAGTNCDYALTLAANPACALPIELNSFTGEILENFQNKLTWVLSSEKDVLTYIVERSSDGIAYTEMARVHSIGNSNKEGKYYAVDRQPIKGENFYRLSVLNKDGSQNVAAHTLVTNKAQLPGFVIYPNPSTGMVNLNLNNFSGDNASVEIRDVYGSLVWSTSVQLTDGKAFKQFELSGLNAGTYFVTVNDGSATYHRSIVITKDK